MLIIMVARLAIKNIGFVRIVSVEREGYSKEAICIGDIIVDIDDYS